jgi:hypothetical protein
MQKNAVSTVFAGVMAMAMGLPNQAAGMSLDPSLGVLSATGTKQAKQAAWCGRRACLGRSYYQSPPPYAYYSYRPWPYSSYFFGSGWATYGFYK